MRKTPATDDEVNRALGIAARLVVLYGERYLPYFVAMEGMVMERRASRAAAARARKFDGIAARQGVAAAIAATMPD